MSHVRSDTAGKRGNFGCAALSPSIQVADILAGKENIICLLSNAAHTSCSMRNRDASFDVAAGVLL